MKGGCGNPACGVSTGIHEGLTFGYGMLDHHGYWEHPCKPCARAFEAKYPDDGECWPWHDWEPSQEIKDYWERIKSEDEGFAFWGIR